MEEKKKKKNAVIISIVGITLFLGLIITATYAYWTLTRKQSDTNVVTASCLDFDLTSVNSGINLASAWPVVDSEGKESTGYTFTVTNHCNNAVDYNVELEETSSSNFPNKYIRFNLDYVENSNVIKDRMDTVGYMDKGSTGRILDSYTLEANSTNTHTLKLWIDEYTPVGYQSKSFKSQINIVGGQGIKAPQILASETYEDEDEPVKYTWYDNGDLFIDILNDSPDYGGINNLIGYLINKYVQDDPDGIFTDATGIADQEYLADNYDVYVPSELLLALVDKPDVAYYKAASISWWENDYTTAIGNMTNNSFKEAIYNEIEDETLADIFQRLSDNMPRFKNVYINTSGCIPDSFMMFLDANRISINFIDNVENNPENFHVVSDNAFQGISTNSIDIRSHGKLDLCSYTFFGLYAPNATLVISDAEFIWGGADPCRGIYVDTIELMPGNVDNNLWIAEVSTNKNKVIVPSNITILTLNYVPDRIDTKVPISPLSSIEVYVRGPQKDIKYLTPSAYKGGVVHWDYYD